MIADGSAFRCLDRGKQALLCYGYGPCSFEPPWHDRKDEPA